METSRAVLLIFALLGVSGVWFSRISGAEVEMRVRRGDDVTFYSDCVWKTGFKTLWFRESSPERAPTILDKDTVYMNHPRYSFVWNSTSQAHDLLLKKVSESDLGLYYCTISKKKRLYGYTSNKGNRTIRLCINGSNVPCTDDPKTTPTPPVSDCSVCWKLLISVCPMCVLLISICVYCIYRYRTTGSGARTELLTDVVYQVGGAEEHHCRRSMKGKFFFHTEVSYTPLNSAFCSPD